MSGPEGGRGRGEEEEEEGGRECVIC